MQTAIGSHVQYASGPILTERFLFTRKAVHSVLPFLVNKRTAGEHIPGSPVSLLLIKILIYLFLCSAQSGKTAFIKAYSAVASAEAAVSEFSP